MVRSLKTGWCTGKTKPTAALSNEEQDVIVSVIKRNEAVEGAERQRVGRLVDKLERIKERIVECGPNQCRLCGHIFRFLRSPKVICEDCQKAVCSKCSIDLIVKRPGTHGKALAAATVVGVVASSGGGGGSTLGTSVHVLCKVCSLTREIWKKSGAWFYKGIPKYDLPPPVQPQYRRTLTTIRLQGNLNTSSSDDDDDDDDVFRLFKSRRKRVMDTTSLASHAETQSTNGSLLETQSLSQAAIGGGGGCSAGGGGGVGGDSESIYSMASCIMVRNSSNDSIREASVGWLEVVLSYDEAEQWLHCSVIRARDLRSMDANGFTDPFCKLNLVTAEGTCRHVNWSRTKTVHKTRNPEFNESISFAAVSEETLLNCWLYIVLLDDDKYGHDFLGTAKVHLAMVRRRRKWASSECL